MKARRFRRIINLYPPYIGAGVRVSHVSEDYSRIEVSMKLRWYNRNYVGTHFGGSLYAMVDPFYMLMLLNRLGSNYIVWDKVSTIRFVKPGRGRVKAVFDLSDETVDGIRAATASGEKYEPVFSISVVDEAGVTVAEVEQTIYVRLKQDDN